jgi:hypothetical protein
MKEDTCYVSETIYKQAFGGKYSREKGTGRVAL